MEKAINNWTTTKWHARHWPGFHYLRSLIFTQQVEQEKLLQSAKVPWECHVLGPRGIFGSSGFLNSCSKLMNLDQTHFSTLHRVSTFKHIPYAVRKQLQHSSLVISDFRLCGIVVSLVEERKIWKLIKCFAWILHQKRRRWKNGSNTWIFMSSWNPACKCYVTMLGRDCNHKILAWYFLNNSYS